MRREAAYFAAVPRRLQRWPASRSDGRPQRRAVPQRASSARAGAGRFKHVIYLQFDNTHNARDTPNVASDLEQMPHLKNFLEGNGTLFTNDHTILISHTAGGILSSLPACTRTARPDGLEQLRLLPGEQGPGLHELVQVLDGSGRPGRRPAAEHDHGRAEEHARPVGAVHARRLRRRRRRHREHRARERLDRGDRRHHEGVRHRLAGVERGRGELAARPDRLRRHRDPLLAGSRPASATATRTRKSDPLPDEPGGYTGYNALYGTKYVDPAIAGGNACVNDTSGDPITDPIGFCGFPGFDGMLAKNTLGYVAAMQESGVQVTYGYISDAHDLHVPIPRPTRTGARRPARARSTHDIQLQEYDDAFAAFFKDLRQHGITPQNTLFAMTVDEGDHFAGGTGAPQSGGSWLVYDHRTCTNLSTCPTNQIGEVNANLKGMLPAGEPAFDIHFDDAPTIYVNGQPPAPTRPCVSSSATSAT